MPLIAVRLALTADWPCLKTIMYMVIWPSVSRPATVASTTQANAPYSAAVPTRPRPNAHQPRLMVSLRSSVKILPKMSR